MFGMDFVTDYYKRLNVTNNSFKLKHVNVEQVTAILSGMNSNKATGLDNLPARFIKDGASVIAGPMTHIINLSLGVGRVPVDMKLARVVPLHKKNSKTEVGNYRPVSILNSMSKVIERIVFSQLNEYLVNNKLLYEFQSGFRSNYSSDTCLIHLCDFIRQECDQGKYTGMVTLDLQKAFDTVNDAILLAKMKALGMTTDAVNWFQSYLSDRQQIVDVNGILSNAKDVTCGVPQGSILGPLLFLIYVNDMPGAVKCKLLLYADDSALMVSGRKVTEIETTLTVELTSIHKWLVDNKLSLHLGKTNTILFGSKKRIQQNNSIQVKCNGNDIESMQQVTYLGLTLDQSISGNTIADKVVLQCSNKVKFLYRNANKFNMKTKQLLVSALIQCHFDYGCSSWYCGLSKMAKSRLQVAQNKAIRFILGIPARAHIGEEEFKNVWILPVHMRTEQLKLNHMYEISNGTAPNYMTSMFEKSNNTHDTRNSMSVFTIPRVNKFGLNSFKYTGIKLWNNLPLTIKTKTSKNVFNKSVKQYMMSQLIANSHNVFIYY